MYSPTPFQSNVKSCMKENRNEKKKKDIPNVLEHLCKSWLSQDQGMLALKGFGSNMNMGIIPMVATVHTSQVAQW